MDAIVSGNPTSNVDNQAPAVEIVPSSSGVSFFVKVAGSGKNADAIKKKIKDMGGHHNAHVRGYKFPSSKQEMVCEALGMDATINLIDPRKLITVSFTQKLQWPGEMSVAESKMKELGMVKKGGRGCEYTGDLNQAAGFLKAFNLAQ